MSEQTIVLLCMGAALFITGCLLTISEKVAAWGLSYGKARIWVKLLGQDRAVKLTRYFFGPLLILMGGGCLVAIFLGE
jgi:hypothetical protein